MKTIKDSAKLTWTLVVIAVGVVLARHWYMVSDVDYFDMVKAFMQTREQVGGVHMFLIKAAFWVSVAAAIVNAVLNDKFGFNILFGFPWLSCAV